MALSRFIEEPENTADAMHSMLDAKLEQARKELEYRIDVIFANTAHRLGLTLDSTEQNLLLLLSVPPWVHSLKCPF